MNRYKTVCVVGLGYIGLPTATILAGAGVDVVGVDINPDTVELINQGRVHIVEPYLEDAVQKVVANGKLLASLSPVESDAFLIAVPTPFYGTEHEPDLTYIKSAIEAIAPVLKPGNLVVLESTSPVGATEQMSDWLAKLRPDLTFPQDVGTLSDIQVAHCPERVLPGKVLEELVSNDRIIGGLSEKCSISARTLYEMFVEGECVLTDSRTAEMAKLTENSFRDVNIAFANELSIICAKQGIDVWELITLANRHPRVDILQPGPGVGGHCIAVDPWFIVSSAREDANLIRTAREVNDRKPEWVIHQVQQTIGLFMKNNPRRCLDSVTVACYGLAFKANIDDLRESPALKIAEQIKAIHQGKTLLVEPNIRREKADFKHSKSLVSVTHALSSADIHVLLVDHTEFSAIRPDGEYLVDTRGIWKT